MSTSRAAYFIDSLLSSPFSFVRIWWWAFPTGPTAQTDGVLTTYTNQASVCTAVFIPVATTKHYVFFCFLNFFSFQPKKEENIFKKQKKKTKSNKIAEEFVWVRRRSRDNGAGSVSFLSYRTSPVYRLERELASCCVRALWRHVGGWAYESNDDTRKRNEGTKWQTIEDNLFFFSFLLFCCTIATTVQLISFRISVIHNRWRSYCVQGWRHTPNSKALIF